MKPVTIIMGSESDKDVLVETCNILKQFGIGYDITVSSAHRSPKRTLRLIKEKELSGTKIFIVGAGRSAHLAGVIASETCLPVIAIPVESKPFNGIDAVLSTLQMPSGVPVATMATGKTGAKNAAIFAIQILALTDEKLEKKLGEFKINLEEKVEKSSITIENLSWEP